MRRAWHLQSSLSGHIEEEQRHLSPSRASHERSVPLLHVASVCCSSCACTCCTANAVVSFASVAYSRAMHASLHGVDHKLPLTGSSRLSSPYASSPSRTFAKRSTRSAPCTKIACQQRPDTGRPVWRQRTDQVGISAAGQRSPAIASQHRESSTALKLCFVSGCTAALDVVQHCFRAV